MDTQNSKDQMRTNVIKESLSTERDYIKHLRDICEVRQDLGREGRVQRKPDGAWPSGLHQDICEVRQDLGREGRVQREPDGAWPSGLHQAVPQAC
jgi:hypothetical protein